MIKQNTKNSIKQWGICRQNKAIDVCSSKKSVKTTKLGQVIRHKWLGGQAVDC